MVVICTVSSVGVAVCKRSQRRGEVGWAKRVKIDPVIILQHAYNDIFILSTQINANPRKFTYVQIQVFYYDYELIPKCHHQQWERIMDLYSDSKV